MNVARKHFCCGKSLKMVFDEWMEFTLLLLLTHGRGEVRKERERCERILNIVYVTGLGIATVLLPLAQYAQFGLTWGQGPFTRTVKRQNARGGQPIKLRSRTPLLGIFGIITGEGAVSFVFSFFVSVIGRTQNSPCKRLGLGPQAYSYSTSHISTHRIGHSEPGSPVTHTFFSSLKHWEGANERKAWRQPHNNRSPY